MNKAKLKKNLQKSNQNKKYFQIKRNYALFSPIAKFANHNIVFILPKNQYICNRTFQQQLNELKMNYELRNAIIAGIIFGITMGFVSAYIYGATIALMAAPVAGVVFGGFLYVFVTSEVVKKQTKLENTTGIIHEGAANHFLGAESVGGKLYLLKDALEFKSHGFNVQNHNLTIYLKDIQEAKTYNLFWFIPNGLLIILKNGQIEKFVVNGRQNWIKNILGISTK